MKTKILICFLSIGLYCSTAQCQKIIINGEETSRKLRWSDFTGNVDNNSPYSAFTKWKVSYKFSGVNFIADSASVKDFQVILQLDPEKSWVRNNKQTDDLLIHEQGHFNVGILCMNEMIQILKASSFSKNNYLADIKSLIQTTVKKYNDLDLKYDEETRHGINKNEQERWNKFFLMRISH